MEYPISFDSAKTVASAVVLSHADYENSLYSGLETVTIKPLQLNQNYASTVVLNRRKFDSASQSLRDLHRLPEHEEHTLNLLLSYIRHRADSGILFGRSSDFIKIYNFVFVYTSSVGGVLISSKYTILYLYTRHQ